MSKSHQLEENMKNRLKKLTFTSFILVAGLFINLFIFSGCYTPSPLYGTWMDNAGNTVRFQNDGSFSAKVKLSSSVASYEGTYVVLDNVLVFEVENPSYNLVTEWDVRGSMLYIVWKDSEGDKVSLTLYLVSK